MTKTLEKQLNKLTLEELFIIAQELDHSFWAYEDLKNFVVDKIKEDCILLATHILYAINYDPAQYYHYNVVNGLFEKVAPITSKNDFIEFLKNYDDEDIKKVLKKYQGGF